MKYKLSSWGILLFILCALRCPAGETKGYPVDFSPTQARVAYGKDALCYFDFWKADGPKPAPLLVFVHGGGFTGGSPIPSGGMLNGIKMLHARGAAFASVEYPKLQQTGDLLAIIKTIGRSIQYLRAHAKELNIDPQRIVCFGVSAGAGSLLWLDAADDLADPQNADPILRQSSKPTAAVVMSGQATYNFLRWPEVLHAGDEVIPFGQMRGFLKGVEANRQALEKNPQVMQLLNELDMLAKLDKNDPPLYVDMPKVEEGKKYADMLHHPYHGKAIFEQATKAGMTCVHRGYTPQAVAAFMWMGQELGLPAKP